jgi:tetratricopeptide (TPR) repeat protein
MAQEMGTVRNSGRTFQVQNEGVKENSARHEYDLFLYFADQVVLGPGDDGSEGIAYALDSIWRQELGDLESALLGRGQAAYAAAVQQFRSRSLEAAMASVEQAEALFPPLLDLQTLWPLRVEPARSYLTVEAGRSAFAAALPDYLRTQEYMKALKDYRDLIETNRRVAALTVKELTSAQQIYDDRDELEILLQDTAELSSVWSDQLQSYGQGAELGLSLAGHASQAGEVLSDISATREGIKGLDVRLLYRVTLLRGADFERLYRGYEDQFEEGVKLQDGTEITLDPIRDPDTGEIVETPTRVEQYPSRAVAIYQPLSGNLEELAEDVDQMLADALANPDYVAQNVELQNHVESLQSLVERITALQGELEPRLADARQAALQAERYRREGMLRYGEAQANVNNRRYDSALQNIELATQAFDTSLSYQEDAEVRRIRSEDLIALADRISRELLDEVIVEVRRLIEEGRRRYAQGDFTGAEQIFRTAQTEWLRAFPNTENEEVNFWLALVQSAVDATTGRTIAETDPLYQEMSQLYNLALEDFKTGRQLIEQGRIGEAREPLDRAESRLLKILFAFPFNAKARVLTLRILQTTDAEAFSERITNLYNDAIRRRGESPQEAYASLKDIEQILPNYPGLKAAIADLEVTLGFRVPPPDPAKIARSRELYQEARTVWDRQQRFLFEDALDNLNQAISLDPDNRAAVVLKDQLLRSMGGGVTIVLSPEDQHLLQQAQQLYVERRYFEALVIVEQLLRKPTNQTNAEILELEKRVRAKTGT